MHKSGGGDGDRPVRSGTRDGGLWATGGDSPDRQGRLSGPCAKTQQAGSLSWHQLPGLGRGHRVPHRTPARCQVPSKLGGGAHTGSWESGRPEWGQKDPSGQEAKGAEGKTVLGQKAPPSWVAGLSWWCVPREGGLVRIQARGPGQGPLLHTCPGQDWPRSGALPVWDPGDPPGWLGLRRSRVPGSPSGL